MMKHEGEPDAPQNPFVQSPRKQAWDLLDEVPEQSVAPARLPQQTDVAEIDREAGEELYVMVVEPEQLRRLDEWLSHLTVWQLYLLCLPFLASPFGPSP